MTGTCRLHDPLLLRSISCATRFAHSTIMFIRKISGYGTCCCWNSVVILAGQTTHTYDLSDISTPNVQTILLLSNYFIHCQNIRSMQILSYSCFHPIREWQIYLCLCTNVRVYYMKHISSEGSLLTGRKQNIRVTKGLIKILSYLADRSYYKSLCSIRVNWIWTMNGNMTKLLQPAYTV